mgnify:CR=1 FL=1
MSYHVSATLRFALKLFSIMYDADLYDSDATKSVNVRGFIEGD